MSKRSKERRRRMEAEADARHNMANNQPVTGDMATRVDTIIKAENNGHTVGHAIAPDNRLPSIYGGRPAYQSQMDWERDRGDKYLNVTKGNQDVGYRPINHDTDKSIIRIVSDDVLKECPIAKVPKVYVPTRLWNEWISLAEDYDVEWLAYLVGRFIEDDKGPRYEVTKMYFPPQTAQSAHVDVDDDFSAYMPNTIGAVHSHVKMGVFFSGEDLAHSNWPVEIVVNAKGEGKVMVRQRLACDRWAKNYSQIMTTGDNASTNFTTALDKAFESGQKLRSARMAARQVTVGYRTPEPDTQPIRSTISANPQDDKEWPFRINGKPHRWNDVKQSYEEVFKVGSEWLSEDEINIRTTPKVDNSQPDGTGDSTDIKKSIDNMDGIDATVTIDEATGQIIIEGEPSQAEIDAGMEAMVDADNCGDCNGEGKLDANGTLIECTGCGGSGKKPWFKEWEGYAH